MYTSEIVTLAASTSSLTNRVDVTRKSTGCGGTLETGEKRPCDLVSTGLDRITVISYVALVRKGRTYRVGMRVVDREEGLGDGLSELGIKADGCL